MNVRGTMVVAALTVGSMTMATQADVLAYWAQNDNDLPDEVGGDFGFMEGDFPQAADVGSGWLTVGGGNILETNEDGVFTRIQSFAGTPLNALDGFGGGGSIAFQGGSSVNGDQENNGAWMQFEISTAGYQDVVFSFATQGTGTGFNNNQVSYSFDGNTFTDFDDPYDPASSWELKTFNFGSLLNDEDTVFVRITFDGATGVTGNNRLDNMLFEANTIVPAPGALALLGMAGLIGARRRRS